MEININELILNPKNPRNISKRKLDELAVSIIQFPRMLKYRGIVADTRYVVYGGNQRLKALKIIFSMDDESILLNVKAIGKEESEIVSLYDFWKQWKKNPMVNVSVMDLTDDEKTEFLVKDNSDLGEWNEKLEVEYGDIVGLPSVLLHVPRLVMEEPKIQEHSFSNECGTDDGNREESESGMDPEGEEKDGLLEKYVCSDERVEGDTESVDENDLVSDDAEVRTEYSEVENGETEEGVIDGGGVEDMEEDHDVSVVKKDISAGNDFIVSNIQQNDFVDFLVINGKEIAITKEEKEKFEKMVNAYVVKNGTSIGFIRNLRNGTC